MTNTIQTVEHFLEQLEATQQFIHDFPLQYRQLKNDLRDIQLEQTDVLHAIELGKGKLNASELIKLTIRLQDIRIERRKIKDMLEIMDSVKNQITSITKNVTQIDNAVNITKNVCQKHNARTYKVRRLHDLKEILPNKIV